MILIISVAAPAEGAVAGKDDRIRTTAESHDRVMVVEIMGRHAGWIARIKPTALEEDQKAASPRTMLLANGDPQPHCRL